MNVLFLTTSFPRRPADYEGVFVLHLARHLRNQGIRVEVVAPNDGHSRAEEVLDGIPVHRFRTPFQSRARLTSGGGGIPENLKRRKSLLFVVPFFLLAFLRCAVRHARRAEAVHCLWFPIGSLGLALQLLFGKPFFVNVMGSDKAFLGGIFRPFARLIIRRSAGVIALGPELLRRAPEDRKFRVIPLGVDVSAAIPVEIPLDPPWLLYAGSLTFNKSVETLILAMGRPEVRDRAGLIIAGDGPDRARLEDLARREGLTGKVAFLGAVSQEKIFYLMSRSSALVLPSLSEGRANVILEAFASGLPVIASDIPANAALVEDGRNGLLFKTRDSGDLADKILALFRSEPLRRRLAEEGKTHIARHGLSWDNTARSYAQLYRSHLSSKEP